VKHGLVRQALILLALALIPGIGQAVYMRDRVPWQAPAIAEGEVTLAQAQAWGDTVMWIDARPAEQYENEHIPNAILLNEDRWDELLPQFFEAWSPEKRLVIYCSSLSCAASHEVARRLKEAAPQLAENVFVLHGGWETWQEAQPK
jgi:rhodanese-related sulfurtransferase